MKEKEIDFTGLSLKEYRDRFAKDLTLEVVRRAYTYSQNGHLPQNAIATAAVLYAEPMKRRELMHHGLLAQKEQNAVTVWKLHTESATAQRELLHGEWDFHNRAECMARLGENYECKLCSTLEFPHNAVIGVCEHRHRFVAVVGIVPESESILVTQLQKIADTVAKNALAYYAEYLEYCQRCKRATEFEPQYAQKPKKFKEFLLDSLLKFINAIDPEYGIIEANTWVTVADFIRHWEEQFKQTLTLTSIDVFGDF